MIRRTAILAFVLIGGVAAPVGAQQRSLSYEDYLRYFSPGEFLTQSDYYGSEGRFEITTSTVQSLLGAQMLAQSVESLDVARNYDVESERPFYKIKSQSTEKLAWDATEEAWVFEYTAHQFDSSASLVWESFDSTTQISAKDIGGGDLKRFYREADLRAQRNPDQALAIFRESVVGLWRWDCVWLDRQPYEVKCTAIHLATGRAEDYSYRKLGQMS